MSQEIIKMIDAEIEKIKKMEGKFDKTFPPNKYLLDLKKAWQQKDLDKVTLIANKAYKDAANLIPSKTSKANEKNILQSQKWISSFADMLSPDNPIIKYADPQERIRYGNELSILFSDCTHDQLASLASQLIIEREINLARQNLISTEAKHLRDLFLDSLYKRVEKGRKSSESIGQLHKEDRETLYKIYAAAKADAQVRGSDTPTFRQFQIKITASKLKPKIIKEVRLTPEEKRLKPEDRAYEEDRKKKERNNEWSKTWIRQIYEEFSAQKATTKLKRSPHK